MPPQSPAQKAPLTSVVDWIYHRFCTLNTVGYDDIIPTRRSSRMLAISEAINGQLLLAILNRAVGRHASVCN